MARRSEHTLEEIKTMVLNAAETLVVEEGFKSLTMRKIALEIGYTVGSIYMVFDNMSDLILQLNGRTLDDMAEQFEQIQNDNPERSIEKLARLYLEYASRNFNRWSLMFEHRLLKEPDLPGWYRDKIERAFARFEAEFSRLAPERPHAQNKQVARALWGGIHGICMLSLTGKFAIAGVDDVETSVMLLTRHFIFGWLHQHVDIE